MPYSSKSAFLRGLREYNPGAYGPSGTATERSRLAAQIAAYEDTRGGSWNYDDLYATFSAVLRGGSVKQARQYLGALEGPGESAAKLGIFEGLCGVIPVDEARFVDEGGRTLSFGKRGAVVRPDFSYKTKEGVFCVFVYPYKRPALKALQSEAILAALASPERREPHFLLLVEYPQISGRRKFSAKKVEFAYRPMNDDFARHMEVFLELLEDRSGTGDLFGE